MHHLLKEESLALDDIVLTEVCTLSALISMAYRSYPSVNSATSS
jgi:hypothetical protein